MSSRLGRDALGQIVLWILQADAPRRERRLVWDNIQPSTRSYILLVAKALIPASSAFRLSKTIFFKETLMAIRIYRCG